MHGFLKAGDRFRKRRPLRRAVLSGLLAVGIFLRSASTIAIAEEPQARPQRIVSINLCTDQLLMMLVPRERIASISYLSQAPRAMPNELEKLAASLPANHGLAEEIILSKADLVLAGLYTSRPSVQLLRRLGYRVVDFAPENNFDDMRRNIRLMGALVGEPAKAEQLIASFDARLAAITANLGPERPIYADIGVNNWMPGRDTLATAITNAAGYRTLGETLGYSGFKYVPLEELLTKTPNLLSNNTPFANPPSLATQALRHPALRQVAAKSQLVVIPERLWACAAPSMLDAVQMLADKRAAVLAK